jgi:Tfp pilus assembly protein PilO
MSFLAILGFLSPIVKFVINLLVKDAAKKAAWHAAWEAKLKSIASTLNRSMDMKTSYETDAAEQDARLAAAAKEKENAKSNP